MKDVTLLEVHQDFLIGLVLKRLDELEKSKADIARISYLDPKVLEAMKSVNRDQISLAKEVLERLE